MNPLISLVIPVYNVEKYLDKCMESVLAQTYDNYEVILVDDGSTDNSGKMCDEYAERDSRVTVYHQKNSGVSVARNVGIENAKGEFISFIDSDDWVDESYLEKLVNAQIKYNADLTICEYTNVYADGRPNVRRRSFESDVYYKNKSLILHNIVPKILANGRLQPLDNPICRLYRKSIIMDNKLVFSPQVCIHEDCFFNYAYLNCADSVIFIDESLYNREVRLNSATKIYRDNIYDEYEVIFNCYDVLLAKYGQCINEEKQFTARLFFEILETHVCNTANKKTHRVRWKEYYAFLKRGHVNESWINIKCEKNLSGKSRLKILLIRLHMTYVLEWLYSLFRILRARS